MALDHISMLGDWPTLESVSDEKVLLGILKFYVRFVRKYAKVTMPISDLLKKSDNARMTDQVKWQWTRDAKLAFEKLTRAITDAPILMHFQTAE